jgi:5-hydroxyisourate hydrolase
VELHRQEGQDWATLNRTETDSDGRVADLAHDVPGGVYRLVFRPDSDLSPFYPEIHIVVSLDGSQPHYHLPLLLSRFGYTTYRGT